MDPKSSSGAFMESSSLKLENKPAWLFNPFLAIGKSRWTLSGSVYYGKYKYAGSVVGVSLTGNPVTPILIDAKIDVEKIDEPP